MVGDAAGSRRPAPVITAWQSRQLDLSADARDARIFASGFDTDNMKARGFVESEMPLPGTGDPTTQQGVAFLAQHLISAAEETAEHETRCGMRVIRAEPQPTAHHSPPFTRRSSHAERLLSCAGEASPEATAPVERALEHAAPAWLRRLSDAALALFDEVAPLDPGANRSIRACRAGTSTTLVHVERLRRWRHEIVHRVAAAITASAPALAGGTIITLQSLKEKNMNNRTPGGRDCRALVDDRNRPL